MFEALRRMLASETTRRHFRIESFSGVCDMSNARKSWWHRYVPSYASNPFGLAIKLMKAGKPAARSALYMAAAGVAMTPIDVALRPMERRAYERAANSVEPIIMVVGPPRSGTTLVAQYLINTFDVCYLNNLTSLFPRSPISANKLLGKFFPLQPGDYEAFYGKSRRLSGANDGLPIWDRWLGSDRDRVPTTLEPGAGESMRQFFGALDNLYHLPVVNKVNRLNTCAHLVSDELQNVRFLCLQRDPLLLAQSLYVARGYISGNLQSAYGVQHPDANFDDPIEDVCRQVIFHENHARRQQELLGTDKFAVISYEAFCRNPSGLAEILIKEHPELKIRDIESSAIQSFEVSDKRKLPEQVFEQMRQRLAELDAGNINCREF